MSREENVSSVRGDSGGEHWWSGCFFALNLPSTEMIHDAMQCDVDMIFSPRDIVRCHRAAELVVECELGRCVCMHPSVSSGSGAVRCSYRPNDQSAACDCKVMKCEG